MAVVCLQVRRPRNVDALDGHSADCGSDGATDSTEALSGWDDNSGAGAASAGSDSGQLGGVGGEELRDNNIEKAVASFGRAIGALPSNVSDRFFVDTVVRIPQAASMRGYRIESIGLARRLEKSFGGEAMRLAAIGEFYMTIEAPLDAVRSLEAAASLRGEDPEIRRRLAQAYRLSLRLNDAIHEYQYVIGLNRKERRGYFELANLYRARGAYRESINLYRAQLEVEPRHSPSWKGLALALLASGNEKEYGEALIRARETGDANDDPALDIYLQSQAALINLARGRIAAARQAADRAVSIEPRYAWARNCSG
jgi:tetratricopeptide (TPR) repeat protein